MQNYFPKKFNVFVGGFFGPSYNAEINGASLTYKVYKSGNSLKETKEINPSPEEWKEFWKVCNRIGLWNWQPRYENPDILDGFSWGIVIEFDDKKLDSSGSNDGPKLLRDLFDSISELLGGVVFR